MADYAALKQRRTVAKASITRIDNWAIANKDIQTDIQQFIVREQVLRESFEKYDTIQTEIEVLGTDQTHDTEDRSKIEDQFFTVIALLRNCIKKLSQTISQPSVQQVVRLPELNVKPFKGDATEFDSFIQIFTSAVIDNPNISDVQRFMYLKSFLRDEPLKLVDNIKITNENFTTALKILRDRYENKITVINTLFTSLLDSPNLTKCTAPNLREFITNFTKTLESLKNLGYSSDELYEFLLILILEQKLDFGSKKAFEQDRDKSQLPLLKDFFEFLENRCVVLENLASLETSKIKKPLRATLHSSGNLSVKLKCEYCQDEHKIYSCDKFKNITINDRRKFVKNKGLCFNCMGTKHASKDCASKVKCKICFQNHHSMLHENVEVEHTAIHPKPLSQVQNHSNPNQGHNRRNSSGDYNSQRNSSFAMSNHSTTNGYVLLSTAEVSLIDFQGYKIRARALLDNGSQTSFVTQKLVQRLNLPCYEQSLCITGVSLKNAKSNKTIDLTIHSHASHKQSFKVSCAVLPEITCKLPQVRLEVNRLPIPSDMVLADPKFGIPSQIDLLIGADVYYDIVCPHIVRLGKNLPVLQSTQLGWVVTGNIPSQLTNSATYHSSNHTSTVSLVSIDSIDHSSRNLETLISKFWSTEELAENPKLAPEDEMSEAIFTSTTRILDDNSYQVDIPFKTSNEFLNLGDSFHIAHNRFGYLENKLVKNPDLRKDYSKFIDDYVALGHAEYVPLSLTHSANNQKVNKYFLPHHAVIREESITSKIRVVFDASCKSSTEYSLNDVTLKGFQVQPNLFDILIRFRSFQFVLTADIEKMFRQIKINPEHRFLLNILWRTDSTQPLECIQLSTVTYGTNCAPYLATRVLKDMAERNSSNLPLAASAILNQTYVDDILCGCDREEELNNIYCQLNTLLNSANFKLHKWCTNSRSFFTQISQEQIAEYNFKDEKFSNTILGLKWKPFVDNFSISVPIEGIPNKCTKRKILSLIAQMYDPLGLVSPVVVLGKIIMQKLWLQKKDWDSEIADPELLSLWRNFIENLHVLTQLQVPRCFFANKTVSKIEVHGFSDASLAAYAASVYLRTIYTDGSVSCHLVASKTRVAPLKTVSIPRLELCGMLLLANLTKTILSINAQRFKSDLVMLWTDSKISLCWIQSHASRWNIFVSNRVSKIQELTSNYYWQHVKSKDNPADLASRGVLPQELINSSLWFHGPTWLSDPNFVPKITPDLDQDFPESIPDERQKKAAHAAVNQSGSHLFWNNLFIKFSGFSKLQRTIAYVMRFISNCQRRPERLTGSLSVTELQQAEEIILITVQRLSFQKEMDELQSDKPLSNKNLVSLKPFIDQRGFLRVGGRLSNADLSFEHKHPLLLPSHTYIVSLLLKREHNRLGHAGPQTTLSNLRLRYWPLNALREIKGIIRQCLTCFRFRAQPATQIMADLPKDRVVPSYPFQKTGVDYAGPFLLKSSNLRKAPVTKAYVAIFICMSVKAVHLEVVTSLSTECFLQCLTRFVSRRGNPSIIYSDNATNFQGAANQLLELRKFFKDQHNVEAIESHMSQSEIKFKFIPPRSPHWGGLWESAVKSAKYHLKRLIGETRYTFEEFSTILSKVEAIMNSRPLSALSNNPNDLTCLTPGHFLIGRNLMAYPEKDLTHTPPNRLNTWKQCCQLQQLFWKRWTVDYLHRLQNRPKWTLPSRNLCVNDLVLLTDNDCPPLRWPLARIVEVLPGADGQVRLVKIKTQGGTFTRSIVKVCPLPINDEEPKFMPVAIHQ